MNEQQHKAALHERALQEKSDQLFAACLQYLIAKEDSFLVTIRDLSQELLDKGYETKFEHRRRALLVRNMFNNLTTHLSEQDERLMPRKSDLEALSNVR